MRKKFYRQAARLCAAFIIIVFSSSLFAQKIVTGSVHSAKDNQPITGASILVKGTNIGTTTSSAGTFTLNVPTGDNKLVISYVGFNDLEVDISTTSELTISLNEKTSSLNEIVVTGYTAQKKKDITGSVAVVSVDNLKSVPSGTTESLLQGQAAGITVINSGQPGGGSNIRIRGITTLGNTSPLVIIDGTPGNLHDLNVNDIESMQVLKDAGAAAIYGVRGSNGVVVVTTKHGRSGKSRINYDGYYGTQRPLKNGFDIANTQATANAVIQQYVNDGLIPNLPNTPFVGNKQFGNQIIAVVPDYITPTAAMAGDPNTADSTYSLYSNQITKANKSGTDWFHEIFKPAPIQSHSISASGGSDKSSYLFSLQYFDQEGTLINTYLKRYSVRVNTNFNIKDKIRVGENAYVFYKENPTVTNQNEGNAIGMSFRESPIIPVYDIRGNYAGTLSQGLGNAQNPVAIMDRQANNQGYDWQINGNVFGEVDFLKHFTARTSFGGNVDNYYYNFFSYTAYENAENNSNANAFQENFGYNSSWTWTNTLRYTNFFGKHNLNVVAGSEAIRNYGRGIFGRRGNYYLTNPANLTVDPSLWTLGFGSPTGQTNGLISGPYENSLFSLFARADYSYNEKYLLSATVRRDGSSIFQEDQRFGVFPSVTGGWRISKESFMQNVGWLNDLKIRGGWGKLGSLSNAPANNYLSLYNQAAANSYYDISGSNTSSAQGVYASQLGNAATTWEEDIITNIGLDATVFKNHFDVSVEWYKKAVSGLLFRLSLPSTAGGASSPYVNLGNIKNTGIDASATYHGDIGKDFKLDVTGTFTTYKNEVVSLPFAYVDEGSAGGGRLSSLTRLQVGQPVGAFFGYEVLGLFPNDTNVVKGAPVQQGAAPGRFQFRDVDGNDTIDVRDRTFFGNPNPKFTYGLNLAASYKNFDLSVFFYGSQGNDVINYVRFFTDFPQVFDGALSNDAAFNSWTPEHQDAKTPRLTRAANFSTTGTFNSYYKENGSYFRCKSLILGYTLPSSALSRFGIDRLRFYLQAANLFTITKYTGLDPELQTSDINNNSNFGIDFGNYPANQKNYNIGVNLSF